MGRRAHCTELWHREDLLDWLLSDRRRLGKLAAHVAKLLVLRQSQFFDHTGIEFSFSRRHEIVSHIGPSKPAVTVGLLRSYGLTSIQVECGDIACVH